MIIPLQVYNLLALADLIWDTRDRESEAGEQILTAHEILKLLGEEPVVPKTTDRLVHCSYYSKFTVTVR